MKKEQREEARRLRREQGCSVNEICKLLGVSKSSVSLWVRDIEMTDEQQAALHKRLGQGYKGRHMGSQANIRKSLELRKQYQEQGRLKAHERDPLHIAGCMLYWGEGAKARNTLGLANSDPDLLKFYVQFLKESLGVEDNQIKLRTMCYLGNGLTLEEIEKYWVSTLGLPKECLRKSTVNLQPRSSQQLGRKLLYGTCDVSVHSTQLVNQVYGAIQEYAGIDKPEWLM